MKWSVKRSLLLAFLAEGKCVGLHLPRLGLCILYVDSWFDDTVLSISTESRLIHGLLVSHFSQVSSFSLRTYRIVKGVMEGTTPFAMRILRISGHAFSHGAFSIDKHTPSTRSRAASPLRSPLYCTTLHLASTTTIETNPQHTIYYLL